MSAIKHTNLRSKRTTIKCVQCGKELIVTISAAKHKKYCSRHCMQLHMKRNSKDVACRVCGNVVHVIPSEIKKRTKIYCSHKCASEDKKSRFLKKCKQCGKDFEVGGVTPKKQIFCSQKCFFSNRDHKRKKSKLFTQYCKHCGKQYQE